MSYVPTIPPSGGQYKEWLYAELDRISAEYPKPQYFIFDETHAAPSKPKHGMLVFADGTDWNPGSGAGLYQYRAGVWNFLG